MCLCRAARHNHHDPRRPQQLLKCQAEKHPVLFSLFVLDNIHTRKKLDITTKANNNKQTTKQTKRSKERESEGERERERKRDMGPFDLRHPFATGPGPGGGSAHHHHHHHHFDYPATATTTTTTGALLLPSLPLGPAPSPPAASHHFPSAAAFSHHERNQIRYSPPPSPPRPNPAPRVPRSSRRSIVGPATAATVVGYGDRSSSEYRASVRTRDRQHADRDRDRDVFFREKETLKQRLERKPRQQQQQRVHHHGSGSSLSSSSSPSSSSHHHHHRARSLSLSRITAAARTSSSPELERFHTTGLEGMLMHHGRHDESDEGDEGYDEGDGGPPAPGEGKRRHRRRPRRRSTATTTTTTTQVGGYHGGGAEYYAQHKRLSMSSPRVAVSGVGMAGGWTVDRRQESRSPESRGERIKFGSGGGLFLTQHRFEHTGSENDLRIGLQRMGLSDAATSIGIGAKLPNPRVPSARRSGSFETVRAATEVGRRTGRSSPGKRGNS